ncbi:hypothetical protein HGM15179_009757 [Zosterops borbonicus]|uniref:Uncharacterized protein n=1 Tax=Zosterops borbonicus TaxID=364589 RepID=A0A8K1LKP1_9PASS|nr:hypothetical protein HGM15179_009757 [Zosterops borbonicus]
MDLTEWILGGSWMDLGWILDGPWVDPGWILGGSWMDPGWILGGSWVDPRAALSQEQPQHSALGNLRRSPGAMASVFQVPLECPCPLSSLSSANKFRPVKEWKLRFICVFQILYYTVFAALVNNNKKMNNYLSVQYQLRPDAFVLFMNQLA